MRHRYRVKLKARADAPWVPVKAADAVEMKGYLLVDIGDPKRYLLPPGQWRVGKPNPKRN